MYLDRETYERAGLIGRTYGSKGDRGLKPRWIVEYDLRGTAMVRGKSGFNRLVHACKEVFSAKSIRVSPTGFFNFTSPSFSLK